MNSKEEKIYTENISTAERERFFCFLLSMADGIGPVSLRALKNYAGSYEEAAGLSAEHVIKNKILNKKQAESFKCVKEKIKEYSEEYTLYLRQGIKIISADDENYPKRLKNTENAPELLYVRGMLPDDDIPAASVIGARACSDYGAAAAKYFACGLAECGVQIISGMAYGIDAAAAEGALAAGGKSFAVLGSGVNVCYPKENYGLFMRMTGIISELHPKAEAKAAHFVMRNRIIAGLGDVLLVIEAREKSGTGITVGYALDQGKDVFVLPGRITDPLGRGCNRLLRDGAIPLTEPEDVLDYLGINKAAGDGAAVSERRKKEIGNLLAGLNENERTVYEALSEEPRHIEEIAYRSGLSIIDTELLLSGLEKLKLAESGMRAYWSRTALQNTV